MKLFIIWQSIGIFVTAITIFHYLYQDKCMEHFLAQYQYPFFSYKDIAEYMNKNYPYIYGRYFTNDLRRILFFYCLFGRLKYIKEDGGFNDYFRIRY